MTRDIRIRVKGLAQATRKIEALAKAGGDAHVHGMRVAAEMIATDVRASRPGAGVPRDEGILAASIRVSGPDAKGVVRITAGGAATPYALRQHEELDWHHDLGEARYLVKGLERLVAGGKIMEGIRANMQAAVRRVARSNSRS